MHRGAVVPSSVIHHLRSRPRRLGSNGKSGSDACRVGVLHALRSPSCSASAREVGPILSNRQAREVWERRVAAGHAGPGPRPRHGPVRNKLSCRCMPPSRDPRTFATATLLPSAMLHHYVGKNTNCISKRFDGLSLAVWNIEHSGVAEPARRRARPRGSSRVLVELAVSLCICGIA